MAKLILKTGEKAGMEYGIEDGMILGRKLEAPVHLNDVKASREHAKLIADGDRFHLVDLNSTNGTYVNEERVPRALLGHGDRIRIGQTVFGFHDPEAPASEPAPQEKSEAKPAAGATPKIDFGAPPPKKIGVKLESHKKRGPRRK
ncbi:MAG: FHA domain-containing protein [Planctomycetota bacterium]